MCLHMLYCIVRYVLQNLGSLLSKQAATHMNSDYWHLPGDGAMDIDESVDGQSKRKEGEGLREGRGRGVVIMNDLLWATWPIVRGSSQVSGRLRDFANTHRAMAVDTPTVKQPPIPGPRVTAIKSGLGRIRGGRARDRCGILSNDRPCRWESSTSLGVAVIRALQRGRVGRCCIALWMRRGKLYSVVVNTASSMAVLWTV